MKLLNTEEMKNIANRVIDKNMLRVLASNMKKYRLKFYNEYKKKGKGENPYSTENIADILGISRRHYTRLENANCISKNISIEKLLILKEIYDISLDDFFVIYNSVDK